MDRFWNKVIDNPLYFVVVFFTIIILVIGLILFAIGMAWLPSSYMDYKVKMEMVKVASKAVDKGLELRLNGDLLKGVELVKITNEK